MTSLVLMLGLLSWGLGSVALGSSSSVSFFGSSHVSLKLQEARSSSDIFFRLRTRRADSMLFLAAGRTDYCLLVLDSGRLKVHINLGAGETEIGSDAPFPLNDMAWHTVNLTRRGAQLSLLVDNHLTKGTLPNRFHELNIHFGIWVGALAGFNEIFLGNLPSFRGCMSQISYNQEDVLAKAKTHLGQIQGVSWNCSDEFDASSKDAYSLTSPNSYVITRVPIARQGTTIKMSIKSFAADSDGLVLYASGVSSRPDYVALEVKDGQIRFVAEMGSGPMKVQSTKNISADNEWHTVMLQVSPYSVSLTVDNGTWSSEGGGRGGSRHLDVSEMVYLGLEERIKSRVRSQGLIDRSFRGCIREVVIGDKGYGLDTVDVTSNISTGCGCPATQACNVNTTTTVSNNNGSLEVITISRDLIRIVAQTENGELEIMRISPIQVAEGDSVIITPRHLAITLDLNKFGIRTSGVTFNIKEGPQQGRIEVATSRIGGGVSQGRSPESFSLLDVGAGRVRYWHSGSEGTKDSIHLSLRLLQTSGYLLPSYLQDERLVTLPIEITSVNDPPEIRLVPGGALRLAEGTKVRLSADVITSLDPDTGPQDLHFSLISLGGGGDKKGFLELASDPGKSIRNFTQADLLANSVWYVDQGQSSSKLAIKVSDGSSVSQTAVIRVETFPLRIAPEVNTGLEVANVHGTVTPISSTNLSFTSNAGDQGLSVEYHVISPPKAGILQLWRTNGQWTATDHFTQIDLQASRLRYLLQRPSEMPSEDEFTFHVSLAETKVPSEFRFRMRILSLRLVEMGRNVLYLNGTTQGPLELPRYTTFPLPIPDTSINYILVQGPRFGYLTTPNLPNPHPILSFNQAQILSHKVIFSFKMTPFSPIEDYFLFNVTTSHLDVTLMAGPFRCDIYHTTKKKPAAVTIKPLIVVEGGREVLSSKSVKIRVGVGEESHNPLVFNITSGPSHGRLEKERESLRLSSFTSANQLVDKFSWQELERGRVSYIHDGSETPRDRLDIVAWNSQLNFMFGFQIDIIVKGVNNHPPQKAPSASLSVNVVIGGQQSLTPHILDYIDDDWDAERGALKYTTKGSPSGGVGGREGIGNIYDRSRVPPRPVFQWTQADIEEGKLIFRHEGSETQGSLQFWVSDGKFVVNATLVINAANPWIRVTNATTLITKKGAPAKLNEQSVKVDTNLDVGPSSILIRVLDEPHFGRIKVNGSGSTEFTLGDMAVGLVGYENEDMSDVGRDGFGYEVVVEGKASSGIQRFDISIYPDAYWTPLTVGANKSVTVNENSSAVISQTSLHIINPHIPPSHIVYTLSGPPSHGYLTLDPGHSHEEIAEDYVTMWDQTVINDGRLRYVQSQPNITRDSMFFHVTNGVQTLHHLRLDFIIIPSTLILATSTPLIINEGSSAILNVSHLHAAQSYFSNKLVEVKVTKGPDHGTLALLSAPEAQLQTFPYKALEEGKVTYTHDGSETDEDTVTFVAVAQVDSEDNGVKRVTSLPHVLRISIISTNDQVPVVVNNTGSWVWMGGSAPISNLHLAATDGDSDESLLVFYVVGSRGGYPALKDNPEESLHNFTQAQINRSLIIFTHKGQDMKQAAFEFEVSDGLNEAGKETFKVAVRKPELTVYEGRVPLPIFPFTQAPIKPENLLIRSSDGRKVHFQVTSVPLLGQVVLDAGEGKLVAVSVFSQTNVSHGKVYYEHLRNGHKPHDTIRLSATSKYSEPLTNVSVGVEISVSGAALGGLQRYVLVTPLEVNEGGQVSITSQNINFSAVSEFISIQHRGNMWRNGLPTLRLLISEVPRHGWLVESDEHRLRPGAEILPSLMSAQSYLKYLHDDSETTEDQINFSLWLVTSNSSLVSPVVGGSGGDEYDTWLLNITLPIQVNPVNDQGLSVMPPKAPISPIVQDHWRKLTRNDVLTSDPDTPPAHIIYTLTRVSHGRLTLLPLTSSNGSSSSHQENEIDFLRDLPSAQRFSQSDVDGGRVIIYHAGPLLPMSVNLEVTDGVHGPETLALNIPVQQLTLTALQSQAVPLRIQQGSNIQRLTLSNIPSHTNGHQAKIQYNFTRQPLHGKLLLKDKTTTSHFSHYQLLQGEISYVQTDMSVANDSFEIEAYFSEPELKRAVVTSWLVNVVSIPLLNRIKEVRSFIKGFAIGGIVAPDESEFSAAYDGRTVLNLGLLDASPLAALTGANPLYEILLPPKYGHLVKIPNQAINNNKESIYNNNRGRRSGRFSHEDVRRGAVIYSPEITSNEIYPRQMAQADEFVFRVLAPGVQPAIGIAKFQIHNGYYDPDKGHTEIISDGSTDPATKRGGGRLRDITFLVTPQLTRDSLVMIGLIIAGVMTLSLFIVLGIRCTCSKKMGGRRRQTPNRRSSNNGGLNNGDPNNKTNGIGIITDAYAPTGTGSSILGASSESEAGLRPLMMSTLSPRGNRNKVSMSRATGSESGSWTSSMMCNDTPTPSVPQCRVTPLCNSSDSGGGVSNNLTCPLLPPTPICDTFTVLPEEISESYGFSYGNLPPPLMELGLAEFPQEDTAFLNFPQNLNHHHILNSSNSSTMTRGTMTLPHPTSNHQRTATPTQPNNQTPPVTGTLRSGGKNQYWV